MRVAVWNGGVLERRLLAVGVADLGVVQPRQVMVLLAGDHEGGQVGGVDGQEYHREQSPDAGHEPETKTVIWMQLMHLSHFLSP